MIFIQNDVTNINLNVNLVYISNIMKSIIILSYVLFGWTEAWKVCEKKYYNKLTKNVYIYFYTISNRNVFISYTYFRYYTSSTNIILFKHWRALRKKNFNIVLYTVFCVNRYWIWYLYKYYNNSTNITIKLLIKYCV